MIKMTARSAKWAGTVLANCKDNTGRELSEWARLAKRARVASAREARAWAKEQGLSIVYQTAVVDALFPEEDGDDALVAEQYSGPKAALRPIYDALAKGARALGADVEIMPRKSQVTFSRTTSFAVVRAATRDRVDVALKLHGVPPTARLAVVKGATSSDPSHVVQMRGVKEVDKEALGWMRKAYERAGARKGS